MLFKKNVFPCLINVLSVFQPGKNNLSELEKRERRAMERKLSEMEEELKVCTFKLFCCDLDIDEKNCCVPGLTWNVGKSGQPRSTVMLLLPLGKASRSVS